MLRSSGFWLLVVGFWLLVACGDEPTAKGQEPIDYVSPVDYDIVGLYLIPTLKKLGFD